MLKKFAMFSLVASCSAVPAIGGSFPQIVKPTETVLDVTPVEWRIIVDTRPVPKPPRPPRPPAP